MKATAGLPTYLFTVTKTGSTALERVGGLRDAKRNGSSAWRIISDGG